MLKKLKENKMFVISIIAILFIPILYAGNFITAFSDPYNRMSDVDVAIVNDDNGTTYDGKEVNIGKDFINSLKNNRKFDYHFVSDKEALNGMKNNKYYFTVKIPSNLSSNVYATLNGNAKEAKLIYMANENSNYISGILGGALVDNLNSELNKNIISDFITTLGTNLDSGKQLSEGMTSLVDGSNEITTNLSNLVDGSRDLYNNTSTLSDESSELANGMSTLNNSYKVFNTSLNGVNSSLSTVSNGYDSLNNSITLYRTSLLGLLSTSTLPDDQKNSLLTGYDQIAFSSNVLNGNLKMINSGINTLSLNSNTISKNIDSISSGNSTLSLYLLQLASGAKDLYNGASSLYSGSNNLRNGLETLYGGINSFNDSISKLKLTDNAEKIAAPVAREDETYSLVKNYGYGFAPYFVSLGLFVGALVTTIVVSIKDKKPKINIRNTKHSLKKVSLFVGIVISQALVLDLILLTTKIRIDDGLLFVGFTILISLAFMAIILMLTTLFGDVGRFISILLLILQLTSCGGTFPIETSPAFYNAISPFMPMTYTVNGLRAIIGNGNMNILGHSIIILVSIIIVCYGITIMYYKKSKKLA